jgi:hypothetical protein
VLPGEGLHENLHLRKGSGHMIELFE